MVLFRMVLNSIFVVNETTRKHYSTKPSKFFCGKSQKEKKEEGCLL